jgi:hypothetical protein
LKVCGNKLSFFVSENQVGRLKGRQKYLNAEDAEIRGRAQRGKLLNLNFERDRDSTANSREWETAGKVTKQRSCNRRRKAEKWGQKYPNAENAEVRGEAQRRKAPFKAAARQPKRQNHGRAESLEDGSRTPHHSVHS